MTNDLTMRLSDLYGDTRPKTTDGQSMDQVLADLETIRGLGRGPTWYHLHMAAMRATSRLRRAVSERMAPSARALARWHERAAPQMQALGPGNGATVGGDQAEADQAAIAPMIEILEDLCPE